MIFFWGGGGGGGGGGDPEAIHNLILKIISKKSYREYKSNITLFAKQFIYVQM